MSLWQYWFLYFFLFATFVACAIIVQIFYVEQSLSFEISHTNWILYHCFAHAWVFLTQIMENVKSVVDCCRT